VLPIKNSPLGAFWQPRMEFTGTTIYATNPKTGLVEQHLDTWDNIESQQYFSVEAFGDVLLQIFNLQQTPALQGPEFTLLKCALDVTVRLTFLFLEISKPHFQICSFGASAVHGPALTLPINHASIPRAGAGSHTLCGGRSLNLQQQHTSHLDHGSLFMSPRAGASRSIASGSITPSWLRRLLEAMALSSEDCSSEHLQRICSDATLKSSHCP
jgi:hypothetical protein